MTYEDLYSNVTKSIIKWINEFAEKEAPGFTFCNFDAHAQLSELPKGMLIGPAGVGMTNEGQEASVVFGVSIAVQDDENLFQLTELISKIAGRLRPLSKLTLYDGDTGNEAGWMVTTPPVTITPVTTAEVRSVQSVLVHALIDLSVITFAR